MSRKMFINNVVDVFVVILLTVDLTQTEPAFRSDLRVASINFINQNTQLLKRNNTLGSPTQSSTSSSTTTALANNSSTISSETSRTSRKNGAVKSEIYKMHNNGLMLLHPQRPRSGSEAKKSQLANTPTASSINYHVRQRVKDNDTESTVADNEHFLESKLGELPQIQSNREVNSTEQYLAKINSENSSERQQFNSTQNTDSAKKNSINCFNQECSSENSILKRWRSVVQGENSYGGERKVSNIYPKHKRSSFKEDTHRKTYDGPENDRNKLFRALRSMMDDPLFDEDQPEETIKQYNAKRRLQRLRRLGKLYGRGKITDIPAIPPIPNIESKIDKLEPLEHIPRFADFKPSLDNWPRFGVPELELIHYPRFPQPRLEEFEMIPGIPHIRPLNKGVEVTGDKRGFPVKDDEFVDQELVSDLHANTAPTPIPSLTDIPALTDIPEIPTIRPAANRPNTSGGVNGKMPVMETVDTKDGKETRISA